MYQAIRHDSGLQVTFLSLSLEGFEFIPAKTIPIFHYCLLPRLLSERSDAWMRPKAPGRWRGHVSQHQRRLPVLYFEGVTWATTLRGSHNGLRLMSLSPEAHGSAEKGTQCAATETPGDGLVWRQESVIIHRSTRS